MLIRIAILLAVCTQLVEAGVGFPFQCTVLGCGYCSTERMRQVCGLYCSTYCVPDPNLPGGFTDRTTPATTTTTTPLPTTRRTTTTTTTTTTTKPPTTSTRKATTTTKKPTTTPAKTPAPPKPTPAPAPAPTVPNPIADLFKALNLPPLPGFPVVTLAPPPKPAATKPPATTTTTTEPPFTFPKLELPSVLFPTIAPTRAPKRPSDRNNAPTGKATLNDYWDYIDDEALYTDDGFYDFLQNPAALSRTPAPRVQQTRKPQKPVQPQRRANINKNTFRPPQEIKCPTKDWTPCVPEARANERFHDCCVEQGLDPACNELCKYGLPREKLETVFMWQRTCPIESIPIYMYCASGGEDARPCCRAHGLTKGEFSACEPFCNPGGGIPPFHFTQLKCLNNMDAITSCYQSHLQPLPPHLRRHAAGRQPQSPAAFTSQQQTRQRQFQQTRQFLTNQRQRARQQA